MKLPRYIVAVEDTNGKWVKEDDVKELEEALNQPVIKSEWEKLKEENQRLRDKMLEAIEYIKLYRHSKGMVVLQDALKDKEE